MYIETHGESPGDIEFEHADASVRHLHLDWIRFSQSGTRQFHLCLENRSTHESFGVGSHSLSFVSDRSLH
jgi:hypothetical protein